MEAIRHYYDQDREHDRLTRGLGILEFLRTLDLLARALPPAPATIMDIGGGTGVYARELLRQGYRVHLLDAMPRHVERVKQDPSLRGLISLTLGDTRSLPYPDASADAALLLGPMYHLQDGEDRATALAEAFRVVRPGGRVVAAAIPRAAAICGDFSKNLPDEAYSRPLREQAYRTGQYQNIEERPSYFTSAYFHRPEELEAELTAAGFTSVRLCVVEGPGSLIPDLPECLADATKRTGILDSLRLLEEDRSLMGFTPHFLGIGQR